jgi:imidazoleglycerol phosphate synthase glutamine amidotransferase subunit HisH
MVVKNNICGVQFHPEKSGLNGLQFLKEFMKI